MPSLKEVKNRIASVNNTRKITSAMKMVASAKLHNAQQAIESMRPYEEQLSSIMSTFVASVEGEVQTPYAASRPVQKVALVLLTSNSSLCGAYNANVIKAFTHKVKAYREQGVQVAAVYPIGRKAADAVRKQGFTSQHDYSAMLDHPAYQPAADLAKQLMQSFVNGEVDRVDLIYHHFKSSATQQLRDEEFLPLDLQASASEPVAAGPALDFIVEPSMPEVLTQLVPKSLYLKLYTALLDSLASEHAARVIAMQVATDNADELLRELTLMYNKTRQQAITAELLDIVGGSMQ